MKISYEFCSFVKLKYLIHFKLIFYMMQGKGPTALFCMQIRDFHLVTMTILFSHSSWIADFWILSTGTVTGENRFFCSVKTNEFQTTHRKFKHGSKILLGLLIHPQGVCGQALAATSPKFLLVFHMFSWFLIIVKVPFKPSNPTSWLLWGLSCVFPLTKSLLGPTGAPPSIQFDYLSSFSQARICPFNLPFWLLPHMSKSRITSPCSHLDIYCAYKKLC